MARPPYLIARQEHLAVALDELTSRGVLTWRWYYDTQRHRAIYWVARAGLREKALDTKQAERVAQAELRAMGIDWLPVPHPGGEAQRKAVQRDIALLRDRQGN